MEKVSNIFLVAKTKLDKTAAGKFPKQTTNFPNVKMNDDFLLLLLGALKLFLAVLIRDLYLMFLPFKKTTKRNAQIPGITRNIMKNIFVAH